MPAALAVHSCFQPCSCEGRPRWVLELLQSPVAKQSAVRPSAWHGLEGSVWEVQTGLPGEALAWEARALVLIQAQLLPSNPQSSCSAFPFQIRGLLSAIRLGAVGWRAFAVCLDISWHHRLLVFSPPHACSHNNSKKNYFSMLTQPSPIVFKVSALEKLDNYLPSPKLLKITLKWFVSRVKSYFLHQIPKFQNIKWCLMTEHLSSWQLCFSHLLLWACLIQVSVSVLFVRSQCALPLLVELCRTGLGLALCLWLVAKEFWEVHSNTCFFCVVWLSLKSTWVGPGRSPNHPLLVAAAGSCQTGTCNNCQPLRR